jgi:hypothetical protein
MVFLPFSSLDRSHLALGFIQTRPSQVRAASVSVLGISRRSDIFLVIQRYAVLEKALPKTADGIEKIADELYIRMQQREEEGSTLFAVWSYAECPFTGVAKLKKVLELVTDDECVFFHLVHGLWLTSSRHSSESIKVFRQ